MYDGILGLTKTEGVNNLFYNLPNLTHSVEQINYALNETFFEKIFNGTFAVRDLFSNVDQLKADLVKENMPNDIVDSIFNGTIHLTDIYENFNQTIEFQSFCQENFLKHFLTVDNSTQVDSLIEVLCQLNLRSLITDWNFFAKNLNRPVIDQYVRKLFFEFIH